MFSSFVHDRRGAVALIFGLAFIPLAIGVGVAIDYSRALDVHDKLQEMADAAALAGARANSDDLAQVQAVAREYFDAHALPGSLSHIDGFTVTLDDDNVVRVEVTAAVETTVTNVVGIRDMDVSVAAEVVRGVKGSLEVALVLDNTGSMQGNKLATLKDVSTKLIGDIASNEKLDAKFALVPFAEYVNVGKSNVNASWLDTSLLANKATWTGCVGSRGKKLNLTDDSYGTKIPALDVPNCGKAISPLTDDTSSVTSAIRSMTANNCTYIPSGLIWGWRVLSQQAPFSEAKPYDEENLDPRKVLVLLTDGANTMKPSFPYHAAASGCGGTGSVGQSDDAVKKICKNAKKSNIEIFTVAFEVDDNNIKNILQKCASSDSNYFDASNSEELAAAFEQMTASFQDIRISK